MESGGRARGGSWNGWGGPPVCMASGRQLLEDGTGALIFWYGAPISFMCDDCSRLMRQNCYIVAADTLLVLV